MNDDRLPAELEATSIVRRVAAEGDFATILRRGDPHSGALLLLVTRRGRHCACLERVLDLATSAYIWRAVGPSESASSAEVADFLARRARFDPDSWTIELDIAVPERFIAETTCSG